MKRKLERDRNSPTQHPRGGDSPPSRGPQRKKNRNRQTETTDEATKTTMMMCMADNDNDDNDSPTHHHNIPRVQREILNKLIGFGAEIAEAIDSNSEAIVSLSSDETHRPRRRSSILSAVTHDSDGDGTTRELTENDVNTILQWLDEEEEQRRAYRKRILQSLRTSHEINMALYMQMLSVLQSVTVSV